MIIYLIGAISNDDDGIHCKFAKNGSCKAWKLIEKYKGEITEEELLAK